MIESLQAQPLALWLVTYAIHSTLLLSAAWLLRSLFPADVERLWRCALLGALLTSVLHVGTGFQPLSGNLAAGDPPRTIASPAVKTATAPAAAVARPEASPAGTARPAAPRPPAASPGLRLPNPAALAVAAWLTLAAALCVWGFARHLRFRSATKDRHPLPADHPSQDALRDLLGRSGFSRPIELTVCERTRVPYARGWWRSEICLPARVLREMDGDQIEAILAHELAHLERRDPTWRGINRSLAALLFFQPLNRKACREIDDHAELRCDARAAALTGRPLALARSLAAVASWGLESAPRPWSAAALATRTSTLRRRVRRLLAGDHPRQPTLWSHALAVVPVAAVLALTPSLAARPPAAPEAPAPRAAEAAPAPVAAPRPTIIPIPRFLAKPATDPAPARTPRATVGAAPAAIAAPSPEPALAPAPAPTPAPAAPAPAPVAPAPQPPEEDVVSADEADAEVEADIEEEVLAEEELERVIEAEMEALGEELEGAFDGFGEAIEAEMERLEEELEAPMELLEEELETSFEGLEEEMEALAEALGTESDPSRQDEIERHMGRLAAAMGELGGEIGRIAATSMTGNLQMNLDALIRAHVGRAEGFARLQSETTERIAREIERSVESGQRPSPEQLEQLRQEVRRLAAEMKPKEEELQRLAEDLRTQLEPMRETLAGMREEMLRAVEDWRTTHADLLREIEQDKGN